MKTSFGLISLYFITDRENLVILIKLFDSIFRGNYRNLPLLIRRLLTDPTSLYARNKNPERGCFIYVLRTISSLVTSFLFGPRSSNTEINDQTKNDDSPDVDIDIQTENSVTPKQEVKDRLKAKEVIEQEIKDEPKLDEIIEQEINNEPEQEEVINQEIKNELRAEEIREKKIVDGFEVEQKYIDALDNAIRERKLRFLRAPDNSEADDISNSEEYRLCEYLLKSAIKNKLSKGFKGPEKGE